MPPRGARRGARGGAGRGRGRTIPKQAQAPTVPVLSPRWPHLTKQKRVYEPLEPQPGCAFLSLSISNLGSHIKEKGWQQLSSRASFYSPQQAADEAAQLNQRDQDAKEQQQELERQEQERHLLASRAVGFVSLKYNKAAWDRGEIPLAQSWITSQATQTRSSSTQGIQTKGIESSNNSVKLASLSSFPSNELETQSKRLTRSGFAASALARGLPPLASSGFTPDAPEFSPLTPTNSVAAQYSVLPDPDPDDTQKSSFYSDLEYSYPNNHYDMSENTVDTGGVDESIKDVIQNLFVMQQHVASFRPEIQDGLNRKVEDLAVSLKKLDDLVTNPSNPIHDIKIAPDIIDYVDDGRNPDIYTRDFVELVQRGNAVMNGKQKAFRNFGKIFAQSLKDNFDGMGEEVDMIMENAGMVEKDGKYTEKQQNGSTTRA